MPWMKVLRKPRLNRTVVKVAVDTVASFARARSLKDMLGLPRPGRCPMCAVATCCQTAVAPCIALDKTRRNRQRAPRALICVGAITRIPGGLIRAHPDVRACSARHVRARRPRAIAGLAAAPGHDRGAVQRRRHHRHVRADSVQGLAQKYGTPFVVDNRAGAGGNIGAAMVARAAKDGHTLLVGTVSTHAINPFIYKNLTHDTEKDFQPVSLIARLPNMLVVNPKIPAKTVAELIEHLKKNEGKLSYGSSGAGTSTHLASELFQLKTGTKMVHVPYRSSGEVMNALIGGHIDLAFDNITLAWPHAKAGTIRALAVTSTQPSATAPEVPPVAASLGGLRRDLLARRLRARRHAASGRRDARRRGEAHLRAARRAKDPHRRRRGAVADDAGGVRRVHRRRAPQVAGGRAGRRRRRCSRALRHRSRRRAPRWRAKRAASAATSDAHAGLLALDRARRRARAPRATPLQPRRVAARHPHSVPMPSTRACRRAAASRAASPVASSWWIRPR